MRSDDVDATLAGLVGLPLWSAVVGTERDPTLSVELGPERRRATRLANPELSFVKRTFEGTHALLVEGAWRVERAGRPLTSARTPGTLAEGRELPALSRATVTGARFDGVDLVLDLDDERRLRVIVLGLGARDPSWTLTTPQTIVTVTGGRLDVTTRPREKPRLAAVEDDDAPVVTAWLSRRGAEPRSPTSPDTPPADASSSRRGTATKRKPSRAAPKASKPKKAKGAARTSAAASKPAAQKPRAKRADAPSAAPKPRGGPKSTPPRGLRPVR